MEEEVDYEADDLRDEATAAAPAEPAPSEARPPRARSESNPPPPRCGQDAPCEAQAAGGAGVAVACSGCAESSSKVGFWPEGGA